MKKALTQFSEAVRNLTSAGGKKYGYADQVVFYRTGGGSVQAIFSFIFNSKLHAIAIANDGAGYYFQFVPKSVLITVFGMPAAYCTGFVETADVGLTLAAQNSIYATGVRNVTNISATDAANAIATITSLEKGTKQLPTTEGYFISVNGALPPSGAMPITTEDGTVPEKRITSNDDPTKPPTGDEKTWLQKNWGYLVAGVVVVGVIVYFASKR